MRFSGILKAFTSRESGATLIETVVALAVLGTIAVCFLSGLVTSSKATFTIDEQATAESLAQSQIELVKCASYSYNATGYALAPIPSNRRGSVTLRAFSFSPWVDLWLHPHP